MTTGPGRPERATWNASLMVGAMSSTRVRRYECLTTDMVEPMTSDSWKLSVPIAETGTWPVIATTGTESMKAVPSPVTRLSAPGPLVAKQTPTAPRRLRAYPSAACAAPCSWRTRT